MPYTPSASDNFPGQFRRTTAAPRLPLHVGIFTTSRRIHLCPSYDRGRSRATSATSSERRRRPLQLRRAPQVVSGRLSTSRSHTQLCFEPARLTASSFSLEVILSTVPNHNQSTPSPERTPASDYSYDRAPLAPSTTRRASPASCDLGEPTPSLSRFLFRQRRHCLTVAAASHRRRRSHMVKHASTVGF